MPRKDDTTFMSRGLGRRLFQARHALSATLGYTVSQTAVAKALGTTGTSIGRYEAGLKVPDLLMIERLALVLRTTPCFLAFGCRECTACRGALHDDDDERDSLPVPPPALADRQPVSARPVCR
jgi:transcriptional regulator with XRE-family HTH domain